MTAQVVLRSPHENMYVYICTYKSTCTHMEETYTHIQKYIHRLIGKDVASTAFISHMHGSVVRLV